MLMQVNATMRRQCFGAVRNKGKQAMVAPHEYWLRAGVEPSLAELLNDPLVRLIMLRDHLAPSDVLRVLGRTRAHRRRRAAASGLARVDAPARELAPADA